MGKGLINYYDRILLVAELEELWDREDKILENLIERGYYESEKLDKRCTKITLRGQIAFLRKLRKVLLKEEYPHPSPPHKPLIS